MSDIQIFLHGKELEWEQKRRPPTQRAGRREGTPGSERGGQETKDCKWVKLPPRS